MEFIDFGQSPDVPDAHYIQIVQTLNNNKTEMHGVTV